MLGSIQTIFDCLTSRIFFLDVLGIFSLLVLISAGALFFLKKIGFFEIKDAKTNEEIAEADTDFYKKTPHFAIPNNEN